MQAEYTEPRRAGAPRKRKKDEDRAKIKEAIKVFDSRRIFSPTKSPPTKKINLDSGNYRRGAAAKVAIQGQYAAGKTYTWEDVVRFGSLVHDGKAKLGWLRESSPYYDAGYKVTYGSMSAKWCKDDLEVMKEQGRAGIKGKPHWLVERDMRGRTALTSAGAPPGGSCV